MTLELQLTSEEEAKLSSAAHARGVKLKEYVRQQLGLDVPGGERLDAAEWDAALDELSQDVDPRVAPIADESLSRRSIYGHRG